MRLPTIKILIIIVLALFSQVSFGQVYQLMPQYGYQANRMRFDSTLQIPTVCGVPTLKSNVLKLGAIAFDSCNNRFYTYNPKTATWSQVSGGGGSTDTTSLSNRIDARVKYTDTASMLSPYFRRSLSANDTIKTNQKNLVVNAGRINTTSRLKIDTLSLTYELQEQDGQSYLGLSSSNNTISQNFQGIGNSIIMGNNIDLRSEGIAAQDGFQIKEGVGSFWYINQSDTIGILPRSNGTAGQVLKLQNGAQMVWANDSIGGSGSDTSKVIIMSVVNATGTTLLKGEAVYLFGATGSTASVKRANNKSDSTSSKTIGIVRRDIAAGGTGTVTTQGQVEKLNLGSYNEGDILYLDSIDGQLTKVKPLAPYHQVFIGVVERANNGNGLMYIKPQNGYELGEIHNVSVNNERQNSILYYDSTNRLWKAQSVYNLVDTTKLSNRINQRLLISDTAAMLLPYMRDADTASLSNRINQRLLISDTSVFDRKQLPAYSFLANGTSAPANSVATYFKDTSGTYTGTITWSNSAPTGTTNHTYRWTRIGRMVNLEISLVYGTVSGASNTNVIVTLPSDAPTPSEPAGLTAASTYMYPAFCNGGNLLTTSNTQTYRGGLRNNAANNGYEIIMSFSAATSIYFQTTVTYWTD